MERKLLLEIIDNKKSEPVKVVKVKNLGCGVVKETELTVRLGTEYATILTEDKAAEHRTLPWGHWLAGYENKVLEHKENYYLRVVDPTDIKSRYLLNNEEITESAAIDLVGARKLATSESKVFNINFENIIRLE